MSTFKITNITHLLGKRDFKANSPLDIEYVDNMVKRTATIKPNESIYLITSSLPLSVHRLRVKNLITVAEISDTQLAAIQGTPKSQKKVQPKPEEENKTVTKNTKPKSTATKKTRTTKRY